MEENEPEQVHEEKKPSHLLGYSLLALCVVIIAFKLRIWSNSEAYSSGDNTLNLPTQLPANLLGMYKGAQDAYGMKNAYGEEIKVKGQPLIVPSILYKLKFSEHEVSLKQWEAMAGAGSPIYDYRGTYTVASDNEEFIKVRCMLISDPSQKHESFLDFYISFDKATKTATYFKKNEPEFELKRVD